MYILAHFHVSRMNMTKLVYKTSYFVFTKGNISLLFKNYLPGKLYIISVFTYDCLTSINYNM